MSSNVCVYSDGQPVAGGQSVWRDPAGNNGIAIYNSDGSWTLT